MTTYDLPEVESITSHAHNSHEVVVGDTHFHLYDFDARPDRLASHAAALAARVALKDKLDEGRVEEASKIYYEARHGYPWSEEIPKYQNKVRWAIRAVLNAISEGRV